MRRDDSGEFEAFLLDYQQKAFSTAYRILGNVHDALDAVLPTCRMSYRVDDGVLVVDAIP